MSLAHEIEPTALHQAGPDRQRVGAEEDRGSEHALEGGHPAPVFLTSGAHAEAFKHFSCSAEANRLTLLLDRESRQKNGHESILSKGNTELGMTGDLKNETAVAAFVQQPVVRL
jgi:hypothetical protein